MENRAKQTLGPVEQTVRGFEIVRFKDRYDHPCSLQMSSLADHEQPGVSAVWLGPSNADPKILASQACMFGVTTNETTGWVPYPLPDEVQLTTRMHLDRDQVAALIRHLQTWLDDGTFEVSEEDSNQPEP